MPNYSTWPKESLIDECASLAYMSFCMEPDCPPGGPVFDNQFYEPYYDLDHEELVKAATELAEMVGV